MRTFTIFTALMTVVIVTSGCEVEFFTTLQNDIQTYTNSQGGGRSSAYNSLQSAIQSAQAKHAAAVEGTSVGNYRTTSKAPFQTEINNAATVLNDPVSTDTDYDNARTTLATAETTFDTKRVKNLDVFIFIDNTGSMISGSRHTNVKVAMNNVITTVGSHNTDARYAIISHDTAPRPGTDFVDAANAQSVIGSLLSPAGAGNVEITWAIDYAVNTYSWTSGSDRIAIFITDSTYAVNPPFLAAQNYLTANNIIAVAVIDTNYDFTHATALFNGPPLNAFNAVPGLPQATIESIITAVFQNNITYW